VPNAKELFNVLMLPRDLRRSPHPKSELRGGKKKGGPEDVETNATHILEEQAQIQTAQTRAETSTQARRYRTTGRPSTPVAIVSLWLLSVIHGLLRVVALLVALLRIVALRLLTVVALILLSIVVLRLALIVWL
jgi:Flp pilus assembly protein TadB